MIIPLSFLLQFAGIFVGVKILNINLKILGVILLTVVPIIVTNAIPGLLGFGIAIVAFFGIIKTFDKSADFLQIIGVIVISLVVQAVLIDALIDPMLNKAVNDIL